MYCGEYCANLNYIRGDNNHCDVYRESYNTCVAKLKNDNKICVIVEDYSVCVLLNTGSTISTINCGLVDKIKETSNVIVKSCAKQCVY